MKAKYSVQLTQSLDSFELKCKKMQKKNAKEKIMKHLCHVILSAEMNNEATVKCYKIQYVF